MCIQRALAVMGVHTQVAVVVVKAQAGVYTNEWPGACAQLHVSVCV